MIRRGVLSGRRRWRSCRERLTPAVAILAAACGARSSLDVLPPVDAAAPPDRATPDAHAASEAAAPTTCPGDTGQEVAIASLDISMTPAILNTAMAVGAGYVYWTADGDSTGSTQGAVFRVSRCGGTVTTIATNQTGPTSIAVDDTYVYWGTNGNANMGSSIGNLLRAPLAGGAATTLETGVADSVQFALGASYVYSTGFQSAIGFPGDVDVWRAPLAGGPEMPLNADGDFNAIAVDATRVFMTSQLAGPDNALVSVPIAGGPLTVLVPTGVAAADVLVIDSDHIYYQATGLTRINKDGTGAVTLSDAAIGALAVDEQNVYWLEGDATVGTPNALKRVPVGGGATTTLLTTLSPAGGVAIALDETYIYWASGENDIYRLPK